MKLEDGIYEVEDLFYENCKFVVAAAQNDIEFAHDVSPEMRLKLEVLHPNLDFSKLIKVQKNVSSERCEFIKSVFKSVLASSTDSKRMTKAIADGLDVFCGCSMFETSFFLTVLLASGLNYTVQKNGAPFAESVITRKSSLRGINTIMAKAILACPAYIKFRHEMPCLYKVQARDAVESRARQSSGYQTSYCAYEDAIQPEEVFLDKGRRGRIAHDSKSQSVSLPVYLTVAAA